MPPLRAANVRSIAAGRLHHDVEASRSKDHGGCNSGRELGMTSHAGGEGGAIEDHQRRRKRNALPVAVMTNVGGSCEKAMVLERSS